MNCVIYCTPGGVAIETQDADSVFKIQSQEAVQIYPIFTKDDFPLDLRHTVTDDVQDFTGKEIGLIKSAEPVKIRVKPDAIYSGTKYYKLSKEAEKGMKPEINKMLEQGILKEVLSSTHNSPVMGLKKQSGKQTQEK